MEAGAESRALVAFTADDFGCCPAVNQAVLTAHRDGVLTGASLMVTGGAFAEAVEIARATPALAVGLHVVLADGRAASPPKAIPRLADAQGRFPKSPIRAGIRWTSAAAGRELDRELAAQFQRFAETGLPLHHVDGHLYLHLHPAVLERVIRLAKQYGATNIRIPQENFALACRHDPHGRIRKLFRLLALKPFIQQAKRRLREEGLLITDHCYGLLQSGRMSEAYVVAALEQAAGPVELCFHPTEGPRLATLGSNRGDLQTLLSPAVRSAAERLARRLLQKDRQPFGPRTSSTTAK
jgi:hopanoid biosynthesis associated protein HpnK